MQTTFSGLGIVLGLGLRLPLGLGIKIWVRNRVRVRRFYSGLGYLNPVEILFKASHLRSQASVTQRSLVSMIPCSTFHRSRTSNLQISLVCYRSMSARRRKRLAPC